MTNQNLDEVLQQIEIPSELGCHGIRGVEGEFIHRWVKEHNLTNTLEVGLACGYSAACIMSGHAQAGGKHTCIDPFQKSSFDNQGLQNIEQLGYRKRLMFYEDYSHHTLPRLNEKGHQFDFALIDGGHRFDQIFLDFYYIDLMLQEGGFVLFHDAWLRSTQMVASFVKRNRRWYRLIRKTDRNLIMFQKNGEPEDLPFHHFREFYTLKGFFSQRLITWLIQRGLVDRFFSR